MRSATDILRLLVEHPGALIRSEQGGYILTWPGGDDKRVLDAEFDQLKSQSYIEEDKNEAGRSVFRISRDGRRATPPR